MAVVTGQCKLRTNGSVTGHCIRTGGEAGGKDDTTVHTVVPGGGNNSNRGGTLSQCDVWGCGGIVRAVQTDGREIRPCLSKE